ncbi:MAG: hypothetical protein AAGA45_01625, partial [Verrucomicrobiota bacterium]
MNKFVPWFCLVIGLLIIGKGLMPPRYSSTYEVQRFAEIPVQAGGRILPLDSVAGNTLRIIRGRETVNTDEVVEVKNPVARWIYGLFGVEKKKKLSAIQWMLELSFTPESAHNMPIFRIDHPEVLGLFGWQQENRQYFSFEDLRPHFPVIRQQASQAEPEPQLRSVYEQQLLKLYNAIDQYFLLSRIFHPGNRLDQLTLEYDAWEAIAKPGRKAYAAHDSGGEFDGQILATYALFEPRYTDLANNNRVSIVPPQTPSQLNENDWLNLGEALLLAGDTGSLHPVVRAYVELAQAWRQGDADAFNATLDTLHGELAPATPTGRVAFEEFFNTFQPFYQASILYVLIFLLAAFSWLFMPQALQRGAFMLMLLAFAVHTFGLFARMYIQDRPPVTNLYSSAIFVGWGTVLLGIILETIYKNGVGSFVSGIVGFITLVIAHNLSKTGDTLEMMQAVLDSNFW